MKTKFIVLLLSILFAMPCVLHAEEVEIQLMEIIGIGFIPGDDPLDEPGQTPSEPPRPTNFRATINGHALSIDKLEPSIPLAHATVENAATGNIVLNQQFSSSLYEQIFASGTYILHIQTDGGALVGQFVVQ